MTPRRALKHAYHHLTRGLARLRWLHPALRPLHRTLAQGNPWARPHPFDAALGVHTSGYVPPWLLGAGNQGYGGCQPSALRRALATLPGPARLTFLDLGCGKGRALAVASENPFARILGVEIDPALCRAARANAAAIRARHPARTPIEVAQGDALTHPLPATGLAVFLFHPFSPDLLQQLASRLTAQPAALTIIYQNPVGAAVLDAHPGLRRWFAATIPCTPDEIGFGPADQETVVCWTRRGEPTPSHPGATAAVEVTPSGARLASAP